MKENTTLETDKLKFESEILKIKETKHGIILFHKNDTYLGQCLDLYGEFSPGETEVFNTFISNGDFVVEAGANIGAHTLDLARIVGKKGKVLAFEPQTNMYYNLCANILLNQLPQIIPYQIGLSNEETSMGCCSVSCMTNEQTFNYGGLSLQNLENLQNIQLGQEYFSTKESLKITWNAIPVKTLDSFNLPQCHFLKIDVEGMEEKVLRGSCETIHKFRPIIYAENDRAHLSESLTKYLTQLGYQYHTHKPKLCNLQNNYNNNHEPRDNISNNESTNLLCIPKEKMNNPEIINKIKSIEQ